MAPPTAVSADPVVNSEPSISQTESTIGPTIAAADPITKMEIDQTQSVRVLNMGGAWNQKAKMLKQGRSIIILCRHSEVASCLKKLRKWETASQMLACTWIGWKPT